MKFILRASNDEEKADKLMADGAGEIDSPGVLRELVKKCNALSLKPDFYRYLDDWTVEKKISFEDMKTAIDMGWNMLPEKGK